MAGVQPWRSLGSPRVRKGNEAQTEVARVELPLPTEVTTQVQIAIAATYLLGKESSVDYFALSNQKEASTAPSNFSVENLTSTSATLRWGVCMSDYWVQNTVKVSTEPIADFSLMADVYDDANYSTYLDLSKLTPNTTYYAYVRFECEDEDYSPWAELVFNTPCELMNLPSRISSCSVENNHWIDVLSVSHKLVV